MTTALGPFEDSAEPYQVMPALSDSDFSALKESLREHGCLVAIEYDEHGAVLDGHHRLRALRELGISSHPRVIRAGLGGHAEKVAHALALNVHRRHLTPVQRAEAVGRLRESGWSVRRIAAATGISKTTVARDIHRGVECGPEVVTGEDGRVYPARRASKPATVYVHSDSQQRLAEEAFEVLGDDVPGKTLELRRLDRLRRVRAAEHGRRALPEEVFVTSLVDIRCSDIADLSIESGTVDLVLTDPPFLREHFEPGGPWDVLGRQAVKWLRPGGLLLAYCSHLHLPRALNMLAQYEADGLGYWWTYAIVFPNATSGNQVWSRAITPAWRPVLAWRMQGGPTVPRYTVDPVLGGGKEKDSTHPWQQGVQEAVTFIDRLTEPGQTIVDPFTGSGTIPAAAARVGGRKVIAADIDLAYVGLAQRRVAETVANPAT